MITYKGRQISETLDEIINPKHTALIVHELLNDFVSEGGNFDKAGVRINITKMLPTVVKLIETARKKGIKVVYMRFTTYPDNRQLNDPMIWKSYEKLINPKSPPPPAMEDTWGWQIISEVAPKDEDAVIRKMRVDCFLQTNLDLILRSNGIKSFVILGVGAERGIVPTVSHGQNLGYFAVVPEDCIRPTSPAFEETAKKFISRYATMVNSADILKAWGA